ncbi:hypothetical protein [Sphingosinicella sp. CPCC 101087]|uniref:hypothetical protein n=1 Tax=Sphingosinicella sp. CPCC 101087 TaxID=2497754 RepID=UPI00101C670C|nr:hypothetical protein [Sphingosinicella sp. CPCC 101087]
MDLRGCAHYVPLTMELLLILSAMLSAVTGAFSASGPEGRIHGAETTVGAHLAAAVVEERAAPTAVYVPENAAPGNDLPPLPDFALADAIPLYADRLIE